MKVKAIIAQFAFLPFQKPLQAQSGYSAQAKGREQMKAETTSAV